MGFANTEDILATKVEVAVASEAKGLVKLTKVPVPLVPTAAVQTVGTKEVEFMLIEQWPGMEARDTVISGGT